MNEEISSEDIEAEIEELELRNEKLARDNERLVERLNQVTLPGFKKNNVDTNSLREAQELLIIISDRCRNRIYSETLQVNYKEASKMVEKINSMKEEITEELKKLMVPSEDMDPVMADSYRRGIEFLRLERRRLKKLKNEFVDLCNRKAEILVRIRREEVELLHCKQDLESVLSKSSYKERELETLIENTTGFLQNHNKLHSKLAKYDLQRTQSATYIKNFIFSLKRVIRDERYLYEIETIDKGSLKQVLGNRIIAVMIEYAEQLFTIPLNANLSPMLVTCFEYLEEKGLF